jgi:hypothetical protein
MSFFNTLGKGLSFVGKVQDFLPNTILHALHLPTFSGGFQMAGDFMQNPKKFQFGREFGNDVKLGALAAGAYLAAPAIASAFGVGGGGAAAGAGAGAASGAPALASAGLPSGSMAAVTAPPMGWSGWAPAMHAAGAGNLTQGMGGLSSLANSVAGGGGGFGVSTFAAPASGTVGGGVIGPGGGAVGTGGPGAASPAKGMNPILKSFLENYMKNKMQPQQPGQQFTPPPMGRGGLPGRQYLPTLGGY